MTNELKEALERVKGYEMSASELEQQRISFAYGNASSDDRGTRETVRRALTEGILTAAS